MKKLLIVVLMIILVVTFVSCEKDKWEFKGTITEINNNTAIVYVDEGETIRSSGDLVDVDLSKNEKNEFQLGDRVKVEYDGMVQEKYPLGINTISVELIND